MKEMDYFIFPGLFIKNYYATFTTIFVIVSCSYVKEKRRLQGSEKHCIAA
jgi:hypothetical protein